MALPTKTRPPARPTSPDVVSDAPAKPNAAPAADNPPIDALAVLLPGFSFNVKCPMNSLGFRMPLFLSNSVNFSAFAASMVSFDI